MTAETKIKVKIAETEIKVKVTVYKQTRWASMDWPPEDALSYIALAWFNEKINQIPQKHQNSTQIYIEGASGYDDEPVPEIEIFYLRDLTNEEIIKQKLVEKTKDQANVVHELKELKRLKEKYENKINQNLLGGKENETIYL